MFARWCIVGCPTIQTLVKDHTLTAWLSSYKLKINTFRWLNPQWKCARKCVAVSKRRQIVKARLIPARNQRPIGSSSRTNNELPFLPTLPPRSLNRNLNCYPLMKYAWIVFPCTYNRVTVRTTVTMPVLNKTMHICVLFLKSTEWTTPVHSCDSLSNIK